MATTRTLVGSAYWASYFVNGDDSGITPGEKALADAWLKKELEPGEDIVDCGEPFFSWAYDLHTGSDFRGRDLVTYTAINRGG